MKTKLHVEAPEELVGCAVPLRFGLPWPRSRLFDGSATRFSSNSSGSLEHQYKTLERWSDGSAKWTLFDALLPVDSTDMVVELGIREEVSRETGARQEPPTDSNLVSLDVGNLNIDVGKPGMTRILAMHAAPGDGNDPLELEAWLTDREGQQYEATIATAGVANDGPVRSSVRVTGFFSRGGRRLPVLFEALLDFSKAANAVKVEFDIWNPQAAYHAGNVWDLGDPGSFVFRDLSVSIKSRQGIQQSFCRAEEGGALLEMPAQGWVLYQDSSGGENWNSRNHVAANGDLTVSFSGYKISGGPSGAVLHSGERASPLATAFVGDSAIGVSVRDFWQNFPGAVRVTEDAIEVGLFPAESGSPHELQGGERKRQTFVLAIGNDAAAVSQQCLAFEAVHVWPDPAWIKDSGAIPWFSPANESPDSKSCREYVNTVVSGPLSFEARREVIDEYGWRNYGDLYADHESVREDEPGAVITHYNNQYDFVYGAAVHALRGKDKRWWHLMASAARHHIDIDTYHTSLDRSAYNHGMFWHTEHYKSAGTATHRTYSRVNKSGKEFGGGPSNEHNYSSGLTLYFLLTGDQTAKNAVLGLADWVINMDDGAGTIWSIIDPVTPTGLASRTVDDSYHGPGRGAGNSINALMDAYSLSGERSYIEKAEELIRRCIHPFDDIKSLGLDKPEYRWSYLVFLQTLGKYLWRKEELGEVDFSYIYARDSLLHYSRWIVDNEQPYADMLDRVELPTETWPAQDIRKAHALYIASVYGDQDESSVFFDKAEYFYTRCIEDLLQFETAYLCRPRVLLTVYGFARDYFCAGENTRSRNSISDRTYSFGAPTAFTPQRAGLGSALRLRLATLARESRRLLPVRLRAGAKRLLEKLRGNSGRKG